MVKVDFTEENFSFKSIEEADLDTLEQWLKENNDEDDTCYSLDSQIFYRRFLEYYVTEDECFIKIMKNNNIIGIFKGRLELEDKKELFIWLYVIDKEIRLKGYGSKIIESIIGYFKDKYSIETIKVGIVEENSVGLAFWQANGFSKIRSVKNFFQSENQENRGLTIVSR